MSIDTMKQERIDELIEIGWVERDAHGYLSVTDIGKQAFLAMCKKADKQRQSKALQLRTKLACQS